MISLIFFIFQSESNIVHTVINYNLYLSTSERIEECSITVLNMKQKYLRNYGHIRYLSYGNGLCNSRAARVLLGSNSCQN